MRAFHCLAVLALPLLSKFAFADSASPTKQASAFYSNANEAFQELLNALPEESLHVALNSLTKFKDGIFESDRHGVERVHHDNPPLATKLIVAAVQDLRKRQQPAPSNNGTSTPTQSPESSQAPESSTPPESSPAPESQTQTPESSAPAPESSTPVPTPQRSAVIVPVPISTTNSNGQATVVSSEILSEATASVAVPVTRTNQDGQTFVSQETKPAVIFTATDSAGSAFVTTSAVDFAPTPGQVLTRTNDEGSTFLTTYTPGGGRVSSILLITTTGPDGSPSVITRYTYVDPTAAPNTGGGGGAPTTTATGRPGLQTGAATKNRAVEALVFGGAVGGAFAFFV